MSVALGKESIIVTVDRGAQLHVCHLQAVAEGPPVLMIHGLAEDSRIFWSNQGRGLGPFLARAGFNVFIADLRGCGQSWPSVGAESEYGYPEFVNIDIPALAKEVRRRTGDKAQTWITHSSGAALVLASVIRHGQGLGEVAQMVHFAARRRIAHTGWRRVLLNELLWHRLGRLGVAVKRYFPARALKLGVCDASADCFFDDLAWSYEQQWLDRSDGFDFSSALSDCGLPRSLYFAVGRPNAWSHPEDVRLFLQELGPHDAQLVVLGREAGNLHDYGHLTMLMHPDAEEDHFRHLLQWLKQGIVPGAS